MKTTPVSLRLPADQLARLQEQAQAEQTTVAEICRQRILAGLASVESGSGAGDSTGGEAPTPSPAPHPEPAAATVLPQPAPEPRPARRPGVFW